jgi:large subunit ribosomal protein L24e
MPVCSFCRKRFKEPRGLTVFTFDGRSIHYCSGKCRKNMEHLKRDPKKTNWVIKRTGFLEESENSQLREASVEKTDEITENSEKKEKAPKKEKAAEK